MHFANVDVAHDGDEALRFLSSQTYDLIVVDWMLPKASGLDIVRTIKASKEHASTPIIMTTGKNDRQDIVMALQTGVDAYLVKPISPAVLTERVEKVLAL
jgi:two-component system chemotaxis response regulator CheY